MMLRLPSERYLDELNSVAEAANELSSHLRRQPNSLPIEFPRKAVATLCEALAQLPSGSVEGSVPILEAGREQCPTIRRKYIPTARASDHPDFTADLPPEYRGGDLDRLVNDLYYAIGTAIDAYAEEYGDGFSGPVEFDVGVPSRPEIGLAGVVIGSLEAENAIREFSTQNKQALDNALELRLGLTDVDSGLKAARSTASMPEPKPKLLRRLGEAISQAPEVLQLLGRTAQIAADVGQPLVEAAVKITAVPWIAVLDAISIAGKGIEEAGARLAAWREGNMQAPGGNRASLNEVAVEAELKRPFDPEAAMVIFLEGNKLPDEWCSQVRQLRFQGVKRHAWKAPSETVRQISRCTNLETLNLAGAPIESFDFLENNTELEELTLASTMVRDLSWCKRLKNLRFLNLNGARNLRDLEGISALSSLEHLEMQVPSVVDFTLAAKLPNLKAIAISTASFALEANKTALGNRPDVRISIAPRKFRVSNLGNRKTKRAKT
jgi:hypothetical protein